LVEIRKIIFPELMNLRGCPPDPAGLQAERRPLALGVDHEEARRRRAKFAEYLEHEMGNL